DAISGSSGATGRYGELRRSTTPACTAPGPVTTPATTTSPGKRRSPGIRGSENASSVCVVQLSEATAAAAEGGTNPPTANAASEAVSALRTDLRSVSVTVTHPASAQRRSYGSDTVSPDSPAAWP